MLIAANRQKLNTINAVSLVLLKNLERQHRVRRNAVHWIGDLRQVGNEGIKSHRITIGVEILVLAHPGHHFEDRGKTAVGVEHVLRVSSSCEIGYRFGKERSCCVIYCETTSLDALAASNADILILVLSCSRTASFSQGRNAEFLLLGGAELSLQVDDVVIEVAGPDIGVVLR